MPSSTAAERAERWPKILALWRAGKSGREIASEIGISYDSAKNYIWKLQSSQDPEGYVAERVQRLTPLLMATPRGADRSDQERIAEQAARDEAAAKERHYRSLMSQKAIEDRLAAQAAEAVKGIQAVHVPPAPRLTKSDKEPQHAVLLASDWHIGAVVNPEETGGLGGYDFDTFCRRLDLLGHKVSVISQELQTLRPITKLTVPLMGDIVDGDSVFPSQEVDIDVLGQVYQGALKTAEFLLGLLHTFANIEVIALPGNHGRLGRKGERKKIVSFDRQLALFASQLTKSTDRIKWAVPESPFWDWEIEGHPIHAEHYDSIKAWNGLPYYGLDRAAGRLTQIANAQDRRFSLMVGGHYHSGATLERPGGIVLLNGSMVGPTEYSAHELKTMSRPMQRLFFVSKEHGINSDHWLWLDEVKRA